MKNIENALVILAGGNGSRFGKKTPKQFNQINGENLIHFFLKTFTIFFLDHYLFFLKIIIFLILFFD